MSATTFVNTGSIQTDTITTTGLYDIVVDGAQGGSSGVYPGGLCAAVSGDIFLQSGATLEIIVGNASGHGSYAGGGGGGSFVIETNTGMGVVNIIELVAGGGGGAGDGSAESRSDGGDGRAVSTGGNGSNSGVTGGAGGTGGAPGAGGASPEGEAGGGGGGGFTGGALYASNGGGGGGSYVNADTVTNAVETPGTVRGNGLVTITYVSATCFCAGTRIRTAGSDVAVESLTIGDRLLTHDGRLRALRWIGRRSYAGPFLRANTRLWPVLIGAGAVADGVPARDLRVSGTHAMYLDGLLIPAECLINGATIVREAPAEQVDYFHLELDSHDIILAEGAPAESYLDLDNRNLFANAADYVAPPTMQSPAVEYAPRTEHGPALAWVRSRLAERAVALGIALPISQRVQLTTPGVTKALIPSGVAALHLCSTALRPPGDHRSLGALITSLHLDGRPIDLFDPCLTSGFHTIEQHEAQIVRWTNGEAIITLAPAAAERILDIRVATLLGLGQAA